MRLCFNSMNKVFDLTDPTDTSFYKYSLKGDVSSFSNHFFDFYVIKFLRKQQSQH